jgi:hypothetical protein
MGDTVPRLQKGEDQPSITAPSACPVMYSCNVSTAWWHDTVHVDGIEPWAWTPRTHGDRARRPSRQLKDLIKESVREAEAGGDMISYSPRTTSLSVARAQTQRDAAEERFFKALDGEVPTQIDTSIRSSLCVEANHRTEL